MRSRHHARLWVVGLGLSTVLMSGIGRGAGEAHASADGFDVVALGATATGRVGDVVKVTIGITNNGPGRFVEPGKSGYAVETWKFTLPPGTETVKGPTTELSTIYGTGGAAAPDKCANSYGDAPFGAGPYRCLSTPILEAGKSSKGTFYLKITQVIANATGAVERLVYSDSRPDSDPTNDKASVIINPDPPVDGTAGIPVDERVGDAPAGGSAADAVAGEPAGDTVAGREILAALGALVLAMLAIGGSVCQRARRRTAPRRRTAEKSSAASSTAG